MHLNNKLLVPLIILLLSSPLLLLFKKKTPIDKKVISHSPNASAEMITISEVTPNEKNGFTLLAKKMELYQGQNKQVICEDVECKIIHEKIDSINMHSDKVIINTITKDLLLQNLVTGNFVMNDDKCKLKSSNISFLFNAQEIRSKEPTTITHPMFTLSTNNIKVNLRDKVAYLSGGVKSTFYPQDLDLLTGNNSGN